MKTQLSLTPLAWPVIHQSLEDMESTVSAGLNGLLTPESALSRIRGNITVLHRALEQHIIIENPDGPDAA